VATAATGLLQQLRQQVHVATLVSTAEHRQQERAGIAESVDMLDRVLYWLHAERLQDTSPAHWQQHLAQHLLVGGSNGSCSGSNCGCSGGGSGSNGSSSDMQESRRRLLLTADVACDWCGDALQQGAKAAAECKVQDGSAMPGGSRIGGASHAANVSKVAVLGCPSCGAAQYCSRTCADAAKKVHNANCW
jgi:hypothetical protein